MPTFIDGDSFQFELIIPPSHFFTEQLVYFLHSTQHLLQLCTLFSHLAHKTVSFLRGALSVLFTAVSPTSKQLAHSRH